MGSDVKPKTTRRAAGNTTTATDDATVEVQLDQSIDRGPAGDPEGRPGTALAFSFKGQKVRTVVNDGETWFVAADVCAVLEHSDPSKAVSRLDDDEKGATIVRTLGGEQEVLTVSESGLYALIFTSRKPEARAFRRWVTGEVIPSIRKTGRYQMGQATPAPSGDEGRPKVFAPSVVLPGPGRYIAVVHPDGTVHLRAIECDAMLGEVTATEARIMCHNLKVIEGHWNGTQQLRSLGMDPHDSFAHRALEAAIQHGGTLADYLRLQEIIKH